MTVSSILRLCSSKIIEIASDRTNGLNVMLSQAATDNGVDAFEIDFSDKSRNFFKSNFGIVDLLDYEGSELPAVCLYEDGDENVNLLTSNIFSGTVRFNLDVHLSWSQDMAKNFEALRYAVHDAVMNTFNGEAAMAIWMPSGIQWNGGIGMGTPGRVTYVEDAGLWLQTLPFWLRMVANIN